MKKSDVVIIGASAAGLGAALYMKKKSPSTEITLFRDVRKTVVPCGIPYTFGILKSVNKDVIPDEPFTALGLNIIVSKVEGIDTKKKEVTYDNGSETMSYDKLLITTGSLPFVPPIEGSNLKNVFTVQKDPDEMEKLWGKLKTSKNIVVIGGGFIGVEMAEQAAELKGFTANITIVEMLPRCLLLALEEEFCIHAEDELKRLGINILTNAQVVSLEGSNDNAEKVVLKDGTELEVDLVIIGVGASVNIELAEKSGIPCDRRGGIHVDKYMQTDICGIFAAGDCASKISYISKKPTGIKLASVAAYEGIVAAQNILEKNTVENRGAVGAFSTKIGDIAIGSVGFTRSACEKEGIDYVVGTYTGPSKHPSTLPDTLPNEKAILIFRKDDGKVIGGHIIGGPSTAEMINIVSLAIQGGFTAEDLCLTQVATHPLLTGSPIGHHIIAAAEDAVCNKKFQK